MMSPSIATKLKIKTVTMSTQWSTVGDQLNTNKMCTAQFMLPELSASQTVDWKVHLKPDNHASQYDMIIGQDLMRVLKIQLIFAENVIRMEHAEIPMRPRDIRLDEAFFAHTATKADANFNSKYQQILDAKYEKTDLPSVVAQHSHLNGEEQKQLFWLLSQREDLFDGSLGTYNGRKYDIELKEGAEPFHAKRPYTVPRAYERQFRTEVEQLCHLGVLRKINRSKWAAGTFVISKKNHTIRFSSDFRELNKHTKRKPYPKPKIQEMLMNLEGLPHATSIDLNMRNYHIELTPNAQSLCTIILPWGKYEYQKLAMGAK
jgi:hypothetical protein